MGLVPVSFLVRQNGANKLLLKDTNIENRFIRIPIHSCAVGLKHELQLIIEPYSSTDNLRSFSTDCSLYTTRTSYAFEVDCISGPMPDKVESVLAFDLPKSIR